MIKESKSIAIIGGGIGGLTLAICLKNSGYDCHIFEKNAEFSEVGAAISIFPNALRVYKKVGILDEILAHAGEMSKVFLKRSDGVILAKSEPVYDLPQICMHRADLHSTLLNNVNAKLYTNHELVDVKLENDNKVKVSFSNKESKIFDAVIGADGIHSKVREYIINDGAPVFRGYNIWRGIVESDFDIGYGSETYGSGQRVGIVPVRPGVYGWWATYNEEFMKNDEPEGTKPKLKRLFGDWHHPIPELIENTETILKNSLSDREPKRGWTKKTITLLGDAAHPTTPNLGQGGCMAIEGAYILSECIKKYGLNENSFNNYEKLHAKRAISIVKSSLQIGQMGQIENRIAVFFRNLFFKLTPSFVALKMVDKYFSYDVTKLKI